MSAKNSMRNLIDSVLATICHPDNAAAIDYPLHDNQETEELAEEVLDFFNRLPGGFFIYKADGNEEFIYANQALLNIMGVDSFEEFKTLTGNSFKTFVHPDDVASVEESIAVQIEEDQYDMDYVEYRVINKRGDVRWLEDYGHFLHSEIFGDIFYVFVSDATEKIVRRNNETARLIHDNQQHKKSLQDLIEKYDSEQHYISRIQTRRLEVIEGLSHNHESILFVDLDSNLVVPYRLSVRTRAQFERELEEKIYTNFVADYLNVWVHPDDKPHMAQCFSPAYIKLKLKTEKSFYVNYRCIYHGELQHLQILIVNVTRGAGCSQVVIGFRNIGEEMHQEMVQKQVLQDALDNARQAVLAKNIFLSNVSHDMRTPLNAIFGYVNLARKNINDIQLIESYLDQIEIAGGHILDSVEKVLSLTYTESQGTAVEKYDCSIKGIISDVCKLVQGKAVRKKIDIQQNFDYLEHPDVIADGEKIRQVLVQLVDNAVKYTKAGGKVQITVSETPATPDGNVNYCFKVKDSGIGISKKFLPHIFEAFEREHNTTASGVFGSGLGLTLAKSITELMGGTISVESVIDEGSEFTVNLPLSPQKAKTEPVANTLVLEEIKKRKILIVEDNEINLEIETEILEDLGFSIDSAENGQVAVDKLKSSPEDYYAVVLMDIQMPVMDGRRATEIIRKFNNPRLAHIPIIALSANAFESDVQQSLQAGLDAHLPKPLDVEQLLSTMSKVVLSKYNKK